MYRVGQIRSAKWANSGLFREFDAGSGQMSARVGTYRSEVTRQLQEVGAAKSLPIHILEAIGSAGCANSI
jgi:hypothetical protein